MANTMTMKRRSFPRAWAEWERRKQHLRRTLLKPPPRLTLSEWADRYRVLSPEASAEAGRWRTDRAPYLREIMDTVSDPLVRRVCWMASSQVGKTEVILNVIGYYIDQDPAPILVILPNERPMGEAFSKDRLAPMIRDTEVLRRRIRPGKARDGDTILHKTFPGGHITIGGANSPSGLASRPIRVVLFDEIDRYPPSAGNEGDPVSLGEQRAATFWNRKIVLISTPTIRGASRIEQEWEASDQRRYYVPCPHCGHMQTLRWPQMHWDTDVVDGRKVHRPETAAYACEACGALIPESAKREMLAAGEWRAENPRGSFPGFHINSLYSPWVTWPELVEKFVRASHAGREQLKTFINLQLGEPWDELEEDFDPDELISRREVYAAEVPNGVGLLTAMVDVQHDRLELLVVGWGAGEESWVIAHHRLMGDPATSDVWERLERLRTKPYRHESGASLRIKAMCVDAGFQKDAVYRYVAPRQGSGVFAVKGSDSRLTEKLTVTKRPNRDGVRLWTFDAGAFKDILFSRLRLQRPGPGYMHFPAPIGDALGLEEDPAPDAEFFHQFGAEILVRENEAGQVVRRYKKLAGRRNEAIDLAVGCIVALHILGPGYRGHLGALAQQIQAAGEKHQEVATTGRPRRGRRVISRGIA